jgi:hypothetical protein
LLLNSSDLGVLFGDLPASKTVSLSLVLSIFSILFFKIPIRAVVLTVAGVTLLGKRTNK